MSSFKLALLIVNSFYCTFPQPSLLKESSDSHPSKIRVPILSLRIQRIFETPLAGLLQWGSSERGGRPIRDPSPIS